MIRYHAKNKVALNNQNKSNKIIKVKVLCKNRVVLNNRKDEFNFYAKLA